MAANASEAPETRPHAPCHRHPRTTGRLQAGPDARPGRWRPTPGAPCWCRRKGLYSALFRSADHLRHSGMSPGTRVRQSPAISSSKSATADLEGTDLESLLYILPRFRVRADPLGRAGLTICAV